MHIEPRIIVWEYTLGCDSNCITCGSNALYKRKNELDTFESLDLVEQIKETGFKRIILSGGEPTTRKDWIMTAEKTKSLDINFGMISNALRWNDETLDIIQSLEPYSIGLSIDGEEKTHDYIRGINGSHAKVFDTIKKLKKRDVTICAVTTVHQSNINELEDIRTKLFLYDVDAWQIQVATPMGRMKNSPIKILDNKGYYKLAKFIVDTRVLLPDMNVQAGDCIGYYGSLEEGLRDSDWQGCMAGIKGLGIESDGKIKACLSMQSLKAYAGNVRERKLKEIWNDPDSFSYNRKFSVNELKGQCIGCDIGDICRGGCQSQSLAFYEEFHNAPYCIKNYERNDSEKNIEKINKLEAVK